MLIEIKVIDGKIIPARYLLPCEPVREEVDVLAIPFPWPYNLDLRGYLAYDDKERDALLAALGKASVDAKPQALDQPDPGLLEALRGVYTTRSEALAALAAGSPPPTLASLAGKVQEIDDRVKAVEEKTAVKAPKGDMP
jgi:hypothetical protein